MNRLRHLPETLLIAHADGTLEGADLLRVRDHLTGCGLCRNRLTNYQALFAGIAGPIPPAPPARLEAAIALALCGSTASDTTSRSQRVSLPPDRWSFTETSSQGRKVKSGESRPWVIGAATAILLGCLAGLWVSEDKLPPDAPGLPTSPIISTPKPRLPVPEITKPAPPKKVSWPRDMPLNDPHYRPKYPKDWPMSSNSQIGPIGFNGDWSQIHRVPWKGAAQNINLYSVIHSAFHTHPKVDAILRQRPLGNFNPIGNKASDRKSRMQFFDQLTEKLRRIPDEELGFSIDPSVANLIIKQMPLRTTSFDELMERFAHCAVYRLRYWPDRVEMVRTRGARVVKRGNIYHFVRKD